MCGPWALPVALLVGGAGLNYMGQQKAKHAQERTFSQEEERQHKWDDQQQAIFKDSIGKASDLTDANAQKKAVDDRQSALVSAISTPEAAGAYLPGSDSAPAVVKTAADKAQSAAKDQSLRLAAAMANLNAPNDLLQKTNIGIARDAGQIGQIGSFKAGSAGVLDAELRAAAQKGAFLRGLGSLAATIGASALGGQALGGLSFGSAPVGAGGMDAGFSGAVTSAGTAPVYGGTLGGIY